MENDLLSAQEVADVLKIARNTVYELIKRGELNSSKVGKQVRVNRQEVDAYLLRNKITDVPIRKTIFTPPMNIAKNNITHLYSPPHEQVSRDNELIICGQDISLDILINHINIMSDTLQVYRSYMGSYNSIYALYQGRVNVATAHLWDGDTDQYNITYIKKMIPGIPTLMIRIGKRKQGFYVQKNNPKGITDWTDLKRKDITIVNRERGSGTRILLDEKLRLMGVLGEYIEGYNHECKTHLAVATTISRKEADVALGSEMGCKSVSGVEFIPLQAECYDLIIRLSDAAYQPYRSILEIIASNNFKRDLASVGGYDVSETGTIIWE